jgi:phosphoserine phosphatase
VREIVEEALESVVAPIVYAEALELIRAHRQAGLLVVIVSASPEEIVAPLARYLGVDEAIASQPHVDNEGRYTGTMAFDAFGPAKVAAMHALARDHGIDLGASYAYSDSATDVPMLEAVGHPVVVNPDRELARVAAERGWEVRAFARPVQVRPVAGRAAPIAAVSGAAALLGIAAWWWWARPRTTTGTGQQEMVKLVDRRRAGRARCAGPGQSTRSRRAATTPRATRMASRKSFFMLAG